MYVITISCNWRIYALSERLLVFSGEFLHHLANVSTLFSLKHFTKYDSSAVKGVMLAEK